MDNLNTSTITRLTIDSSVQSKRFDSILCGGEKFVKITKTRLEQLEFIEKNLSTIISTAVVLSSKKDND
jgi:hypothetical protein